MPFRDAVHFTDSSCSLNETASSVDGAAADKEFNIHGGSFFDQFFALTHRHLRQMMRDKVGLVVEIVVPLVFLIFTIILWGVWPPARVSELQYVQYETLVNITTDYQTLVACSNEQGAAAIPTLPTCTMLATAGTVSCDGDESTLPVRGLCYLEQDNSNDASGDAMTVHGPLGPVAAWLSRLGPTTFVIPRLDTIITLQWLARKTGKDAPTLLQISRGDVSGTHWNSIYNSGLVFFVGSNLEGLIQYFNHTSKLFWYTYGGTYDTLAEAQHTLRRNRFNWAIIEVRGFTVDDFDVIIHMNASSLPTFSHSLDYLSYGVFSTDTADMYVASGFLTFQQMISEYYLQYVVKKVDTDTLPIFHLLTSYGNAALIVQKMLVQTVVLLPFILVLSFLYPVTVICQRIVAEKELRIREAMHIMGLGNAALYLSWLVNNILPNLVVILVIVTVSRATYMPNCNVCILFLIFFIFALTCVPLAAFLGAFFSKSRLAALFVPIVYFIMTAPLFAITSGSASIIAAFCILPPTALAVALLNVAQQELRGGYHRTTWNDDLDLPRLGVAVGILSADFALFTLLALYLDAVIPKDWGTPKHPLFFIIDPIQYCCRRHIKTLEGGPDGRDPNGVFEEGSSSVENCVVELCGLRKEYKRNGHHFAAVDNLYWTMRGSEISVLLGHNGAGKTTTMNMMTGMTAPDEGDCYVYGYSVRTQLQKVRQLIGFCPQHNILWPELTCREHLEFFGRIKGLKGAELEMAVNRLLRETGLQSKMKQPSRALSGGQKRKLSIAIAFVGRSPLVFLDEPTAGLDVGARRQIWELLKRMAQSHTILLTTHYMDEADLLGHRIGIMSQGRLKCNGSSVFLKSRLGVGYQLIVSLAPNVEAAAVDELIIGLVPSANATNFTGSEILYKLPMSDVDLFPDLLAGLEENGEANGVRGYSLSATTLEEVFLQVAMEDFADKEINGEISNDNLIWQCSFYSSSSAHSRSQLWAMIQKRWWNALRDRRMQCFQIVCPVACILLAMLFTLVKYRKTGIVELSASMFGDPIEMEISHCHSHFGGGPMNLTNTKVIDHNFVSGMDMSSYMVDTFMGHSLGRYASIYCDDPNLAHAISAATSSTFLFYNTSAYHAAGMVMSQLYTLALQHATANPRSVMRTEAHVLPASETDVETQNGVQTILIGAIVMTPFTFLPSNPVAWIVKERQTKARHLQDISGLRFHIYWLSNFIFDISSYIVTMILAIIIFVIFSRKEYVSSATAGPTIVSFIIYGLTSTVASYAFSFAFKEYSAAQTITMAVSFVLGFLLVMMVFILSLVDFTKDASDKMRWPFRIVPSYCIGECIINLAVNAQRTHVGMGLSPWSMDVVGWPCVYMSAEFPLFVLFTLFFDHPRRRMWGQRSSYDREAPSEIIEDEDSDVEDERLAVYEQEAAEENEDIVRVVDLRKVYHGGTVAVRNLAFSILPDEVFGFLGTNGAGKTTTISILCQEFLPTSGSAYVCGYDVVEYSSEALQCIGYCPQFDVTLDLLTVEEHLYMYAGVRGIVDSQRKTIVEGLMQICDIDEYRNTTSSRLSGGNRRKLSVAISLIGAPQVVFLDEPSAGMDPVARRGLWKAITKVAENCSIVLTTHHLEEVEALANTVAIMANGALRCIGDKIHLKKKYGSGFEMSLRVSDPSVRHIVNDFVEENFPNAVLNEYKGHRFVYALPPDTLLSETFHILQTNKQRFGITDYSVSQTSIEQVFLRISEQEDIKALMPGYEAGVNFGPSHATLRGYRGNSTARRRYEREQMYSSTTTSSPTSESDESSSSSSSSTASPHHTGYSGLNATDSSTPSPGQSDSNHAHTGGDTTVHEGSPYNIDTEDDEETVSEQDSTDETDDDDDSDEEIEHSGDV